MIKELFNVKGWKAFMEVLPEEYIPGFIMTLKVALAGLLLALALGVIFGMLSTVKVKVLNVIARIYVEFFQNTPLVVQVFFYYNCLPFVIGGLHDNAKNMERILLEGLDDDQIRQFMQLLLVSSRCW